MFCIIVPYSGETLIFDSENDAIDACEILGIDYDFIQKL